MIRKATFENFKGLRHVEVTFDSPFTVLVGPNGSGKTSVLQGIELVIEGWFDPATLQRIARFQSKYSEARPRLFLTDETTESFGVEYGMGMQQKHAFVPAGTGAYQSDSRTMGASAKLPTTSHPIIRPHYRSGLIATASVTQQTPPPVSNEGQGLPSLLGYLKLRDDELFDKIEEQFCRVITNIKKIRVDRSGSGNGPAGETILFDTTFASKVPADQMSDGTLYILALIVAILGPHRPKTLLIDDLDLRLHPKAQYELVTLLKQFLKEFPDLQIIATSHSPYILDKLEPNEVRVTGLDDDGSVVVARLDEHPQFAKWKDAMSPGEFWSHVGEDWLRGLHKNGVPAG